jgi:hypothetical protein
MVLRLPLSACECTCPGKNLKGLLGKKNLSLFPNTNTKLKFQAATTVFLCVHWV